jgi:hypothetical protein
MGRIEQRQFNAKMSGPTADAVINFVKQEHTRYGPIVAIMCDMLYEANPQFFVTHRDEILRRYHARSASDPKEIDRLRDENAALKAELRKRDGKDFAQPSLLSLPPTQKGRPSIT